MGHGDNRRAGQKALVVVPHIRSIAQRGVDHGDLFKAIAQVGIERVNFWFTKIPGNRQVLFGPQLWDVQHKGFMFNQCCLKRGQRVWQMD
ncbi:hypothetical protein D3C85_1156140 [compost metagenome]